MIWRSAVLVLFALGSAGEAALAQAPTPFTEEQFKASGHKPVDGAHLKEMMVGNTGYFLWVQAQKEQSAGAVTIHFWKTLGRVVVSGIVGTATGEKNIQSATWWMDGDRYCANVLSRDVGHIVRCRLVYDLGGVLYACQDGKCDWVLRIVPGNPEGL